VRPIVARAPVRDNAERPDLRADQPPPHPANPGHVAPRSHDDIQQDPRYSDRAKRIAASLDARCRAPGKWAAWPKVATIAADLGWDDSDYGGRKRVERGLKELVDGGDLTRMTLRELVEWHDSEGRGLAWPKELPRGIRLSLKVCVLNWRIPAPSARLPILPECDTGVALNRPPRDQSMQPTVASDATLVSHAPTTPVSPPILLNVRTSNGEATTDGGASSSSSRSPEGGEGRPDSGADGDSDRAVLVARVEEITPGPGNAEVRRAICDALQWMLATARLGGSPSPADHVRIAIEKAAASPARRESIESYAKGTMRNWAREGFPAIVAPEPPGRPKPAPDPEADRRAAVERRNAALAAEARDRSARDRWEALPEPAREAFRAEFERTVPRPPAGPFRKLWEVQARQAWAWRAGGEEPGPSPRQ
jgi:hypothetical protein